jgi:hypothetical protein
MPKHEETKDPKGKGAEGENKTQGETLQEAVETGRDTLSPDTTKTADPKVTESQDTPPVKVAAVTEAKSKPRLVKVKFIKAHEFAQGTEKFNYAKDETASIEPHIANKLVERGIAFVMG